MKIPPLHPQLHLNGYLATMKNMFISSSISLIVIQYSSELKEHRDKFRAMSLLLLCYSIYIGYISAGFFSVYIGYLEKNEEELNGGEIFKIHISEFKSWVTMTYIYVALLVGLLLLVLYDWFQ
jgi:hypothetical protein